MNVLEVRRHVAVCQRCYTHGPECSSVDVAHNAARQRGWLEIEEKTLCPDCRREKEEERKRKVGNHVG